MVDILIGVLPLVFMGLLIAVCYDRQRSLSEAIVVGALGWGLAAVTSLELLSLAGKISRLSVGVFWCLVSVGATLILIRQRKKGVGGGASDTHVKLLDYMNALRVKGETMLLPYRLY